MLLYHSCGAQTSLKLCAKIKAVSEPCGDQRGRRIGCHDLCMCVCLRVCVACRTSMPPFHLKPLITGLSLLEWTTFTLFTCVKASVQIHVRSCLWQQNYHRVVSVTLAVAHRLCQLSIILPAAALPAQKLLFSHRIPVRCVVTNPNYVISFHQLMSTASSAWWRKALIDDGWMDDGFC